MKAVVENRQHHLKPKGLYSRLLMSLGEYLYEREFMKEVIDKDRLTGLYDRDFFDWWMPKILMQADRVKAEVSLVFIDLDGLKQINDTLGHRKGDAHIRSFTRRVIRKIRATDALFRIGGDEFLLVFWACNKEEAEAIMVNLQEKLLERARFSYGVVEAKGRNIDLLVKKADEAMYEMKKVHQRKGWARK